jgi:catalase
VWKSLAATPLVVFLAVPAVALAQEAPVGEKSQSEQTVDALNGVFGVHPGARAAHAKGIVLEGTFTPSASAAPVSKAAHLQKKKAAIPVTVRFSDGPGVPTIPDTEAGAEVRDLFLAIAASKPDSPKPTALDTFLSTHPATKAFVEAPKPAPVSFGTLAYYGVNAFKFTNAKGVATFGRYQLQPVGGVKVLTSEQVSKKGPDYLSEEIRDRVHHGPIKYKLLLQVAGPDDKIDDPTIAWPDSRKKVELGTLVITKVVKDSHAAEKQLLFMPGALVPGIEAADPMIADRSAAYIVSLSRRAKTQ